MLYPTWVTPDPNTDETEKAILPVLKSTRSQNSWNLENKVLCCTFGDNIAQKDNKCWKIIECTKVCIFVVILDYHV